MEVSVPYPKSEAVRACESDGYGSRTVEAYRGCHRRPHPPALRKWRALVTTAAVRPTVLLADTPLARPGLGRSGRSEPAPVNGARRT